MAALPRSASASGVPMASSRRIDLAVHPADEEAGDAGDLRQVGVDGAGVLLEAVDVRLHHLLVAVEAEDERDVDVATLGDHLLDGGQPLLGAGDLHHQVGPVDLLVQRTGRRLGARPVVGQTGGDLDADVPVAAEAVVVQRGELVERAVDVRSTMAQYCSMIEAPDCTSERCCSS
jgi:hypothetical protein